MAKPRENLTGKTIGRLIVKALLPPKDKYDRRSYHMVECSCGSAPFKARTDHLKDGNIQSCGCLRSDTMRKVQKTYTKRVHK